MLATRGGVLFAASSEGNLIGAEVKSERAVAISDRGTDPRGAHELRRRGSAIRGDRGGKCVVQFLAAYGQRFQPEVQFPKYQKVIAGHAHRSLGEQVDIGSMQLTALTSDRQGLPKALQGAGQPNADCTGMKDMSADGGEENARSLGVLLTFGRRKIVSLGDLTWNVEKALVCPDNKVGHVDLFFVSNHGTNLNNSPALLHALSPRVAIMGNGEKKGGDPETYDTVSASPGLKRLWQLHLAGKGGRQHNPPDDYIANPVHELRDDDRRAALGTPHYRYRADRQRSYAVQPGAPAVERTRDRNLAYLGLVEILYRYPIDAAVLKTGCDKTTPSGVMAASTVDIPAIVLSDGPMLDGWFEGNLVGSGTVLWQAPTTTRRRRDQRGAVHRDGGVFGTLGRPLQHHGHGVHDECRG